MTGPRKKSARGTVTNAILIALALGLLGHVISKNQDLIGEVFRHKLDLQLLVLAFLCYFVAKLLTFVRWYWLVRAIEPSFRFDVAIVLGFIGNLFNLLIPGAIGGDLIKAAYLAKMDVNKTRAIASMVIDRLIGLLGLFIVAGVAGTLAWSYASVDVRRLILVVWFAVGLSVPALILIFSQSLSQICTSGSGQARSRQASPSRCSFRRHSPFRSTWSARLCFPASSPRSDNICSLSP
jgi:uncharacterized protein (TIRG00374 family)